MLLTVSLFCDMKCEFFTVLHDLFTVFVQPPSYFHACKEARKSGRSLTIAANSQETGEIFVPPK